MSLLKTATSKRKLAKKRSVDLSGHKKFWEMREQGAGVNENGQIERQQRKVFRCMCCGATTRCKGDYGGEPDISKCTKECQAATRKNLSARKRDPAYEDNYVAIFGHE